MYMVRLNEDGNRIYHIGLLKYVDDVELNEVEMEDDNDKLIQLKDIVDNDPDHQEDDKLSLHMK